MGLFGLTSTNDGVVVSNDSFATAAFSQTVNTGTIATVPGTFADMTLVFTTGAVAPTGNIRLFVKEVDPATRIHVDNFRLDGTLVPEPSSAAAILFGAGLLIRRRRV